MLLLNVACLLLNVACSFFNVACLHFAHAKWYVGLSNTHVLARDLIFDLHILMESRHLCFVKVQFSSTWELCHLNFARPVDIPSRDLIILVFFVWTACIHLRNLFVLTFTRTTYIHSRNLIILTFT